MERNFAARGLTGEVPLAINALNGPIPKEFGLLTNVKDLDLSDNDLEGPLPLEVGNIKSLVELKVQRNRLSGRLPSGLSTLTSLTRLYLDNNQFEGQIPPQLEALRELRFLVLRSNRLTGWIPAQLNALSLLTTVTSQKPDQFCEDIYGSSWKTLESPSTILSPSTSSISIQPPVRSSVPTDTLSTSTTSDSPTNNPMASNIERSLIVPLSVSIALIFLIAAIATVLFIRRNRQRRLRRENLDASLVPVPSPTLQNPGAGTELKSDACGLFSNTEGRLVTLLERDAKNPRASLLFADLHRADNDSNSDPVEVSIEFLEDKDVGREADFGNVMDSVVFEPEVRAVPRSVEEPTSESSEESQAARDLSDLARWSPSEVEQFLLLAGVGSHLVEILKGNGIDGYQLLLLNEQRLLDGGVELSTARSLILHVVDELRSGRLPSTSRSSEEPLTGSVLRPGESLSVEWQYFPNGSPGVMGEEVLEFNLQDLRSGMNTGTVFARMPGSFAAKVRNGTVTIPSDAPSGDFAISTMVYNTYFSSPLIKIVSAQTTTTLRNIITTNPAQKAEVQITTTRQPAATTSQRSQSNKLQSSFFMALMPTVFIMLLV
ncbi:hypothetical protein HDU67_000910 [Dinochytrium kinnereticum]|nr:hypothetical protein HDU67_000910 [Dinochytrium kinnereticum]